MGTYGCCLKSRVAKKKSRPPLFLISEFPFLPLPASPDAVTRIQMLFSSAPLLARSTLPHKKNDCLERGRRRGFPFSGICPARGSVGLAGALIKDDVSEVHIYHVNNDNILSLLFWEGMYVCCRIMDKGWK